MLLVPPRNRVFRGSARLYTIALLLTLLPSVLSAQIVINEIMYHPLEPWPDTQVNKTTNLTEFIEILNAGTQSVDLTRYRFDNGVSYNFPAALVIAPGAYLVVCQDLPSFTNAYPGVGSVVGEYSGSLRNSGERLTLAYQPNATSAWTEVDSIEYLDLDEHDGTGKSMELVNPGFHPLRNHYAGDWAASLTEGGTPGVQNDSYQAAPLPVVGDVVHNPPLPFSASSVEVTARVQGRDGHVMNSVLLEYRLDSRNNAAANGAWTNAPMNDLGINGDLLADDGVYTAMLPEFGASPMQDGDILQYRIKATDNIGTATFPTLSRSGVLTGPYSYLMKFEDDNCADCAFQDEYPTFHILLTTANKNELQTRPVESDVLLDGALVTSDGKLYQNCGIRLRGGSSRSSLLGNYRIVLPHRETYDGLADVSLNHDFAFNQYLGMITHYLGNNGYGSKVALSRVFLGSELKQPVDGIYVRIEPVDDEMISRLHPDDDPQGNRYAVPEEGTFTGNLAYIDDNKNSYVLKYLSEINNPYTGFQDLTDLIVALNEPVSTYPTTLSNYMAVAQWGRHFGIMVMLDNREAGFGSPTSTKGDELKLYARPDGPVEILPWDMSDVFKGGLSLYNWSGGGTPLPKILFNRPVISHYLGGAYDVGVNFHSATNLSALLDSMGSKMTAPKKTDYLANAASTRALLKAQISTNMTITGYTDGATTFEVVGTNHADTVLRAGFNQNGYTGQWVYLGNIDFVGTPVQRVTLTRQTAPPWIYTIFDAMMFSNSVAGTHIIDDSDPEFTRYGSAWTTVASGGYNNGSFQRSAAGGTGAAYGIWDAINLPTPASYDVYVWLFNAGSMESSTRYLVESVRPALHVLLDGTAPQNYTEDVFVNGVATDWHTRSNRWYMSSPLILYDEPAQITVSARDVFGQTTHTKSFDVFGLRDEIPMSGLISSNTVWGSDGGVFHIDGNLTVAAAASLTIQAGTRVVVNSGVMLTVNGTLLIEGNAAQAASVLLHDGTSQWTLHVSGANAHLSVSNALIDGVSIVVDSLADLALTETTVRGSRLTPATVTASGGGFVRIQDCIFDTFDGIYITSTPVIIDGSLLQHVAGTAVSLSGSMSTAQVSRTTCRDALPGASAIGVAVNSVSAILSNLCVNTMSGTGVVFNSTSSVLTDSLLTDNGISLQATLSTSSLCRNNTILDDAVAGVVGDVEIENVIIRACTQSVLNGPALASHSNIEGVSTNLYPGPNNLNCNPWFLDVAEGDYRLQSISPSRGTGTGGVDQGARFPVGAAPASPTELIFSQVDTNSITLTWTDNSNDEDQFQLQRSDDGAVWQSTASVAANQNSFTDAGVVPSVSYQYRVRAEHARGLSYFAYSANTNLVFSDNTQNLISFLRISELNYNPAEPPQPSPYTDNDFEFIEFVNLGPVPLNLSGCFFESGLTFEFPPSTILAPGAYFMLVRTSDAFLTRYPAVSVDGVFAAGGLNNGGERLHIKTPAGTTILDFTYSDNGDAGWHPTTDGEGYSLVLTDPAGNLDSGASWGPSANIHGSPGEPEPAAIGAGILISEVLSHTDLPAVDAIEIYNSGTTSVDVAGWFLSDTQNDLKHFQLPLAPPIVVPPGEFHVFYEDTSFNQDTNSPNSFELSSLGDEVYFSSNIGTNLSNHRISVRFGASENGVSFCRHVTSDKDVDFVASQTTTLGASNSLPRVGPVVINEIMYNPGAGGKEYIELYNASGATVQLYDPAHPANTWALNGAVEYSFPSLVQMAPGEYLLITELPSAEFRARFNITNTAIQILGPYAGNLSNSGDSLKLYKPDAPEANGFVPQILVDRVKYSDRAPWPIAADGDGPSLERISPVLYGNDPATWVAGSVGGTPATANNILMKPTVGFKDLRTSRIEMAETLSIPVAMSPGSTSTVRVHYVVSGTATPDLDYTLPDNMLVFCPYETEASIPLEILNDVTPAGEPEETVTITLTTISGDAQLGGNIVYTHTIVDNDATTLAAPTIQPGTTTLFTNSISITIQNNVPGSLIYYTTDGQLPTRKSKRYTGVFTLTHTARVTARSYLGPENEGAFTSVVFKEQTPQPGSLPPPGMPWLTDFSQVSDTSFMLQWASLVPLLYSVERSTNMLNWPGQELTNDMPASGTGFNAFIDLNAPPTEAFYKIGVRNP